MRKLRVGDWVEVRSKEEILARLLMCYKKTLAQASGNKGI